MKGPGLIADVARRTYRYVEGVIAMTMLIGGAYLASPLYYSYSQKNIRNTAVAQNLQPHWLIITFGILYALPGLFLLVGLFWDKKRVRSVALFWIWLVLLFTVGMNIATGGLNPLTWLSPMAIGLIAGIIWLRVRWEFQRGGY